MIRKQEKKYAIAFYESFIIALIIVWLPLKAIPYITPIISLVWFIIRANSGRTVIRLITFLGIFLVFICVYFITYKGFILSNAILSLITYGAFIFYIVLPKYFYSPKYNYLKYVKVVKIFLFIETLVGLLQIFISVILRGGGLDLSAGDVVQGTIKPLAFMGGHAGFGNQMYAINMVFLLLFITPYVFKYRKNTLLYLLAFIALFLSSVMHVFIAAIVAIVITIIFFRKELIPKLNTSHIMGILVFIFVFIFYAISQPSNYYSMFGYINSYSKNQSPKVEATFNVFTKVSIQYPTIYMIGLGPGQYSSKAGLIGSGHYFGSFHKPQKILFLPESQSEPFKEYVFKLWETSTHPSYGSSTMNRPFYSILSIYTEFGTIVFILIVYLVYIKIKSLRKYYLFYKYISQDKLLSLISFISAVSILFLLVIAFFENYLETTQAIFVGLLLIKLLYNLNHYVISENIDDN